MTDRPISGDDSWQEAMDRVARATGRASVPMFRPGETEWDNWRKLAAAAGLPHDALKAGEDTRADAMAKINRAAGLTGGVGCQTVRA